MVVKRATQWAAQWSARLTYRSARELLIGDRKGPGHVLGIDQATCSGWALLDLVTRRVVLSGEAKGHDEREAAIALMSRLPGLSWASVLVVFEDHRAMPLTAGKTSAATMLSLGETRGQWKALLTQAGQPEAARLLVAARGWEKTLGARQSLPRAERKQQALRWARALTGKGIEGDDEAEAVCIAYWGALEGLLRWAQEQSELASKRRRRPRKGLRYDV